MFDRILIGLHEVDGVQATLVIDADGRLVASRAHAVYDQELLEQASRTITSVVDSVQLVQDDWELVTATYTEGKVLIRNLHAAAPESRAGVLAVIADSRLSSPFAGVAIRVAASKLKAALDAAGVIELGPPTRAPLASGPTASVPGLAHANGAGRHAPGLAAASAPVAPPRTDLAGSGQSWAPQNGALGASSSVSVKDDAASGYLAVCVKALSKSVGPIARLYVREAVHRVCPDRPFAREDGAALVAELVQHIRRPSDRTDFQRVLSQA